FDARKELEKRGPSLPKSDPNSSAPPEMDNDVAARNRDNTVDRSSYVPARILWPALGFPAVIAPNGNENALPAPQICLLIMCDRDPKRRPLSKLDVAKHLRIVPWAAQHKRWLPTREKGGTNAFREEDISVTQPKLIHDGSIDESPFWQNIRKWANKLG